MGWETWQTSLRCKKCGHTGVEIYETAASAVRAGYLVTDGPLTSFHGFAYSIADGLSCSLLPVGEHHVARRVIHA